MVRPSTESDASLTDGRDLRSAPALVRASLLRSRTTFSDPARATVRSILGPDELEEYRNRHQLSSVIPLIRSLLTIPAEEHGLIMAVGDETGRLLWVEGDAGTRSRAEDMAFLPGADWSESSMGTSAPGIAVATGAPVQVRREEHFAPQVTQFSCSAVPLTDPVSGESIGFLDLTGGDRAVDSLILPYLLSTASAVQSHLAAVGRPAGHATGAPGPRTGPTLVATGRRAPTLRTATGEIPLSLRHAEILAVLTRTPVGLDTAELAEAIYPTAVTPVTVRAEITRLRRTLATAGLSEVVRLSSRPYRVTGLSVDALNVEDLLGRGAHVRALKDYAGALLPESEAPMIVAWREELAATVRETVLADASAETLMSYLRRPEAAHDVQAWTLALKLLPAHSPKRAAVLARLDSLDCCNDLATPPS